MSIASLAQLGRIEKEIEINSQLKVKLHTLSVAEQQKALAEIPESADAMSKFAHMQIASLVYATSEINGLKATPEELHAFYLELQHSILADVFNQYLSLTEDQNKQLEELKKK